MFRIPEKKIIFLHIPKTGGSSIAKAIGRHYRLSRFHVKAAESRKAAARAHDPNAPGFEERMQILRSHLLLYAAESGARYLTGHVWYTDAIRSLQNGGYSVFLCLRDPVDRFISNYLYDRFKSTPHMQTSLGIDEYLSSPEALRQATTYVRYLGGVRSDGNYASDAAVFSARHGLQQVDQVGFLDQLPIFSAQIGSFLGRSIRIKHERMSPAPERFARNLKSSVDIRDRVAALCSYDYQIYNFARSRAGSDKSD